MLGPPPPPSYPPVVSDDSVSVDPLRPEINIDVARLEGIFSYNALNPLPIGPFHSRIRRPLETPTDLSAAVYALTSMFNHACLANAGWQSLGDVIIIRARRPIAAGEEITIPYTTGYYEDCCRFLPSMIGRPCDCQLCEDERKDTDEDRRTRIKYLAKLMSEGLSILKPVIEIQQWAQEFQGTYSPSRSTMIKLEMASFNRTLGDKVRNLMNEAARKEAVEYDMRVLENQGFIIERNYSAQKVQPGFALPVDLRALPTTTTMRAPVAGMILIARSYQILGDNENAEAWLKSAHAYVATVIGSGKYLLINMFGPVLDECGALPVDLYAIPTTTIRPPVVDMTIIAKTYHLVDNQESAEA
ncbi:hypothetical protein POSPLADRAFT_1059652 [Postia placenta MAD-698-R-SB12]|uniref:SET domain-containing protein n=1 Tax=Postia placenta MAD-698-R-SB12 TaxID=670580 RepID=A0A1X6MSX1_9APHY|nr:hypothetical protein POSPLADRAFT_1059652 [Postia placenta MAD-698-R-SB12]OSX59467.1 hypothetical protein POSPLADRAFT_1059652 [Postia placenta MAD-698-R-SB12]